MKSLEPAGSPTRSSYAEILRSLLLTGGSQVLTAVLMLIHLKIIALMLGPAGVGIASLLVAVGTLANTVFSLGLGGSAAQGIAHTATQDDPERLARLVSFLRRIAFVSGILGTLLMALLSKPLSRITFGEEHQSAALLVIAAGLLVSNLCSVEAGVLQGFRRIRELAVSRIWGAFAGAASAAPLIAVFNEPGIAASYLVPILITCVLLTSYRKRMRIPMISTTWGQCWTEGRSLVFLGSAFLTSSLIGSLLAYGCRWMITHSLGIEAAGLYGATTQVASVYAGFVLHAMGLDLLPRLSATSSNPSLTARLLNEQIEMGLLTIIPGVMATLSLAPWLLTLLFAPEFAVASEVARWQSIGVLFRVLAYPFGYGLLAWGRAREFIRVEIFSAALHQALLAAGLKFFGFKGAGLAYAGGCAGGMLCTYLMTRKPFAFTWSPTNRSLMTWTLVGTTAAFLCTRISSPVVATASASLLTVLAIVLSTLRIRRLLETRSGLESHVAHGRTEHPSQPL